MFSRSFASGAVHSRCFPVSFDLEFFCVEKLPLQAIFLAKPFIKAEIAVLVVHDDRITEFGEV